VAEVTIREARNNLRALIERAAAGEQIVILRRGREVARLVPPQHQPRRFPDLTAFRASIVLKGEPVTDTVVHQRREARY
jgi:prevent-host-death family protein